MLALSTAFGVGFGAFVVLSVVLAVFVVRFAITTGRRARQPGTPPPRRRDRPPPGTTPDR